MIAAIDNNPSELIGRFLSPREEVERASGNFARCAEPESLLEKYRPSRLDQIVGQDNAVTVVRHWLRQPHSTAFLLAGAPGIGKTALSLVIAEELGCRTEQGEFGGLWQIPSGEQNADNVRALVSQLHCIPFYGTGWKVAVINEADYMSDKAEAVWLDVLEHLPPRTVVCFTTNSPGKLSERFRDRCTGLALSSDPKQLLASIDKLARRVYESETGQPMSAPPDLIQRHVIQNGQVSFRRVVQTVARMIAMEA